MICVYLLTFLCCVIYVYFSLFLVFEKVFPIFYWFSFQMQEYQEYHEN